MSQPIDFAAEYQKMSNEELLALARDYDGLTDAAQGAIRSEFAKRGLEPPILDDPEPQPEWSELATVTTFRDVTEALVAQSVLRSAGIAAYLFDDNFVRIYWYLANFIGGVRLKVKAEDESAAKEILGEAAPASIPFSDGETYLQPQCPKCGSSNISFNGAFRGAALAGLYVAAIPLPTGDASWSCNTCGARWQQSDD